MTTHQGGVKGSASQQKQYTGQPSMGGRFLIGEELGRGAYGQVFKGMDSTTGDVVAIKQIGLAGVSQENLAGVMGEIDLLKTLNHKNIVKYVGSFKSRSHLYIILEYMENGALSSVIKPNRFGVFPESLVAIYIAQVLQGLAYLHEQGVVHRDIKGANILTTKDGLVKLADFGVAAKLGELEEQHCDELHQNVAGSPYWMAPEVIEMTQVTPASDIWSVGCLIIELLTGYPPYYDLQPMSALFRIVQDGHPPLPENVSPLLEDFLLKCFQKDPSARPDARSLLQHEWVQFNRRTLRGTWNRSQGFKSRTAAGAKATDAHETVNSVVSRILQAEGSEDELSLRGSTEITAAAGPGAGGGGGDAAVRTIDAAAGPLASNTPARLALQQDALQSAGVAGAAAAPINLLNAPTLPSPVPVAGSPGEVYTIQQQQQRQRHGSIELAAAPQQANGPTGPSLPSPRSRLSQPSAFSSAAQQQQQYALDQQQLYMQQQQQDQEQGSPGAGGGASYVGQQLHYGPGPGGSRYSPARTPFQAADAISPLSSLLARIQGDAGAAGTPSAASVAAAHGGGGSQSLLHWLDDGPAAAAGRSPGSFSSLAAGPSKGQLLESGGLFGGGSSYLVAGASTNSLDSMSAASSQVGLENGGGETNFQLEAKRKVRDLVRSLRPGARDANMTPQQAALGLAAMFGRLPDARQHFLSEGGVLAALELLESDSARLAESAVDLLAAFTAADTRLLESLCLVGLVPIVVRMAAGSAAWPAAGGGGGGAAAAAAAPGAAAGGAAGGGLGGGVAAGQSGMGGRPGDTSAGGAGGGGAAGLPWGGGLPAGSPAELTRLRSKAAGFVAQLCFAKETTLQMFIACGGLRGLVVMVQDNLADPSTLTLTAVACIWQVLETYGALPLNYICRIFAHAGLVQRLHAVIKQLISLGRQQQTLQQQQQQQRGVGPAAAAALKLHHLHSPSSPSVFGQALLPLGLEGGEGLEPGGGGSSSSSSAAAAAAAAAGRGRGREAGLAGMDELQQQRMDASSGSSSSRLPQLPQQQQQQHRRAHSVDDQAAAAAAAAAAAGGPQQTRAEWLLEKCLDLLLVMAHMDGVVKGVMCSRDNLQQLLDLTQRLGPPSLLKVMKTIRWLTSEPGVLPAVKDSGAIGQLVPFLSREREALVGQVVVLEALQALYNICKFNKRVHLEVAATGGIVPHLCRFASEAVAAAAAAPPNAAGGGGGSSLAPAAGDPLSEPAALSAAAARDARRAAVRTFVVPLLIGMASTSSSTRAKLWASNGLDLFLQLLGTEDSAMQVGLMRTLDIWLAEDAARVENRLCQREAVGQLSEVYSRLCRSASARSPVMPQMLDSLKVILNRSPKVAVALAAGGLVPPLLEPLTAGLSGPGAGGSAPILRAKLLEIIRLMYQHSPCPKEFVLKYRIQDVLLRLLEAEGRGEDAVKVEAQKLLNAFHINVLL